MQNSYLKVSEPTSKQPERDIIRVKYAALQFGKLSEQNLWVYAKAILLKIHVITGWTIPSDKMMDVLLDQFVKKLRESYPDVNPEEMEYAFRHYGTVVKDWGKNMNLSLIDEVMTTYLDDRYRISHEVEERKEPPPAITYTDEELDNFHRQWTEEFYQRIRRGLVEKVPDYSKSIMVKDGLIRNGGEADNFFVRALNSGMKNIYTKTETI